MHFIKNSDIHSATHSACRSSGTQRIYIEIISFNKISPSIQMSLYAVCVLSHALIALN